jgi:hypothetical protein
MVINNPDFLQRVILSMAEEAYKSEVIETEMKDITIGEGLSWVSKEEWISDFIVQHFNLVKESLLDQGGKVKNTSMEKETFLMRLYSLDIAETFEIDNFTRITRFPGGWAYKSHDKTIFIPYDDEFKSENGILAKEFEMLNKVESYNAK